MTSIGYTVGERFVDQSVDHIWTKGVTMKSVRVSAGSVREWHGSYQARFCVSYTAPDGTEVRKQVTKSYRARSLAAARRGLPDVRDEVKDDLERRLLAERVYPGDSDALASYMARYIDEREKSGAIEATTASNYRSVTKHVMRHLCADIRLLEVDAATVRRMDADLLADGLAPDTVGKAHRFVKQVLDAAEDEGLIARNPVTRGVRPPKRQRHEPEALDEETTRRLRCILGGMTLTPLTVAIRISMETGLRNEEALGLKWSDIEASGLDGDTIRGTIHVRRAVTNAGGKIVVKAPKSAAGHRDIPVTDELMAVISAWAGSAFDAKVGDSSIRDLYVLGGRNGKPYNPTRLTRGFRQLAQMYDLRCTSGKLATYYTLRHTAITAMLRAGVDAKTVSAIAGHSKVAETLDVYASADATSMARAVEMIAKATSGKA